MTERIVPPTNPPTSHDGPVAFYAFMTASMTNIGGHHILFFDSIKTNLGSGLHNTTGVFTAPKSGFYVFTWTVRVNRDSYHGVELVVNGQKVGSLYLYCGSIEYDQGSSTAVIYVNEGSDVYLRTNIKYNNGPIVSDTYGYSSFAGWKLT